MITCGEKLVELLAAYGVDMVFGIPGVHTVELYRGLPASGIRHVTPRHEQGAGFMADGYARVSGRPGICFVITGPGLTNIATAMGQAYADSVPMLVISSVNRTEHLGMGEGRLHELPSQRNLAAGLAEFSHTLLTPDGLPEVLARAFSVFGCGRPRPVHIEIPLDVIAMPSDHVVGGRRPLPVRPGPSPDAIARATELLRRARRPLVVLGGGAIGAAEEALALVESLDAPAVNTVNAKGILPPSHPLKAGENMAFAPIREAIEAADVVLAVGTEFGETEMYPEPQELTFGGRLIRIDIDGAQLVRTYPAEVPILSDARLALAALNRALGVAGRREIGGDSPGARTAAAVRAAVRPLWGPGWASQKRVMDVVRDVLGQAIIVGDSTQLVYSANHYYEPESPRSYFNSSTGYGTLGYALPAAVGAKLAAPKRPVVCVIGDGGIQFTLPELASAVEAQTPIAVLLWNNQGYKEIKTYMAEKGIAGIGVDIYTPDLLAIARGFGCRAERADSLDHLRSLLGEASDQPVPTLIEVLEDAPFLANG